MKKRRILSRLFLVMVFASMLTGCGESIQNESGGSDRKEEISYKELGEGDEAPDFTVELVDGESISLSEQRDKIVLLNFWATWCGPCVREMPAFETLAKEYKDEVYVIAVNCMEDKNTVSKFVKEKGYTFPVAYDVDGEICMKYPSDGIPYTLIIDKEGIVQRIYLGAGTAEEQYEEYKKAIDDLLGK